MNSATSKAVNRRFGSPLFAGDGSTDADRTVSAECADSEERVCVILILRTLRRRI
jgi:hypothetical protein